jgi:hypothetical protein
LLLHKEVAEIRLEKEQTLRVFDELLHLCKIKTGDESKRGSGWQGDERRRKRRASADEVLHVFYAKESEPI